MLFPLKAKVT